MHTIRHQTEALITLEDLVPKDHPYRACERVIDIRALAKLLDALYSDLDSRETGAKRGLRMLVLQFMLDLSDRQVERFMNDNTARCRFCGFGLQERKPDHSWFGKFRLLVREVPSPGSGSSVSWFGKFRRRLGTKGLMDVFAVMREWMKRAGLVREAETFVDAGKLESKLNAWKERDRVIAAGCEASTTRACGN